MPESWLDKWNERYSREEYAFGTQPNDYLKQQLEGLKPGSILFPAEGEGRNAVFAAKLGWDVSAFDISSEGKKKALRLARDNDVAIDYRVGGLEELTYKEGQFDAIALIYAHFPAEVKSAYHRTLDKYLRNGGILIFEAFGKNHIDYVTKNERVGGPRDLASLFSIDEIRSDFANYTFSELKETETDLKEGLYHNGKGWVIRATGIKR